MMKESPNVEDKLRIFRERKQLLMVDYMMVNSEESDFVREVAAENENLKQENASLRAKNEKLEQEKNNAVERENASLRSEIENLKKEKAKQIKRLENEVKSMTSKAKAVELRHSKEVTKLNKRLSGKEKAIKLLRKRDTDNTISNMMSQKMTTRSSQHRAQLEQKFPPNNLHSQLEPPVKKFKSDASIKSEPGQSTSEMKTDEEDEILASPQASQVSASQTPLFGDNLAQILNSDTQESAVFGTPTAPGDALDEE